jgi:hypothetical protein
MNYLDITGESRKAATDPSLIASDGLHFSGKEYGVWADKMEPIMKAMLMPAEAPAHSAATKARAAATRRRGETSRLAATERAAAAHRPGA